MQFKTFALFGLLGGAIAQSPIASGFSNIATALDALDASVLKLAPGQDVAAATTDLKAKAEGINKALSDAITTIKGAKELTIAEASGVLAPSKALQTSTKKAIDNLIAKKDIIAKAGQTAAVKTELSTQASLSKQLSEAVVAKMPAATKSIAQNQADAIGKEIARGIAAYQ